MRISKNLIILSVILLAAFAFILFEILTNGFLVRLDVLINSATPHLQSTFFISFSKIINIVFDTSTLIIVSIIIAFWLWFKKDGKSSIFFGLTMLINGVVIYLLKIIVHRARPLNALITEKDFAFPSGHAMSSIIFFGLLTYLVFKSTKEKFPRVLMLIISIVMVIVVSLTRLLLCVHWLSDILGGIILGALILVLAIIIKEAK